MHLLLLGCTGFVGKELIPQLLESGHELSIVGRTKPQKFLQKNHFSKPVQYFQLDPSRSNSWNKQSLLDACQKADGVINLAGEPIAEKRWTPNHMKVLQTSRLNTTKLLIEAISKLNQPPRVLINASAIGYYGTNPDYIFTEKSPNGNDFLAKLCKEWEHEASKKPKRTRLLIIRIGIVLGKDGGAIGKMFPVFKAGLGGPIGSGKQWMSWIHRKDLCKMIESGLNNESWEGVVNGVSPEVVSMSVFASSIAKVLNRPCLLKIPGPILKLLLGDGAKVVLEGQKVVSERLSYLGFTFKYAAFQKALKNILN